MPLFHFVLLHDLGLAQSGSLYGINLAHPVHLALLVLGNNLPLRLLSTQFNVFIRSFLAKSSHTIRALHIWKLRRSIHCIWHLQLTFVIKLLRGCNFFSYVFIPGIHRLIQLFLLEWWSKVVLSQVFLSLVIKAIRIINWGYILHSCVVFVFFMIDSEALFMTVVESQLIRITIKGVLTEMPRIQRSIKP